MTFSVSSHLAQAALLEGVLHEVPESMMDPHRRRLQGELFSEAFRKDHMMEAFDGYLENLDELDDPEKVICEPNPNPKAWSEIRRPLSSLYFKQPPSGKYNSKDIVYCQNEINWYNANDVRRQTKQDIPEEQKIHYTFIEQKYNYYLCQVLPAFLVLDIACDFLDNMIQLELNSVNELRKSIKDPVRTRLSKELSIDLSNKIDIANLQQVDELEHLGVKSFTDYDDPNEAYSRLINNLEKLRQVFTKIGLALREAVCGNDILKLKEIDMIEYVQILTGLNQPTIEQRISTQIKALQEHLAYAKALKKLRDVKSNHLKPVMTRILSIMGDHAPTFFRDMQTMIMYYFLGQHTFKSRSIWENTPAEFDLTQRSCFLDDPLPISKKPDTTLSLEQVEELSGVNFLERTRKLVDS